MPHTKSAVKRARQSEERRQRTRAVVKRLKTLTKRVEVAAKAGDKEKFIAEVRESQKSFDQAAAKGVIHKNTASRNKSQLEKLRKQVTGDVKK